MRFPNKLFSFNESIFVFFPDILMELKRRSLSPLELYRCISDVNLSATTSEHESIRSNLNEFLDALDALYALQVIEYDDKTQKLIYLGGEKNAD